MKSEVSFLSLASSNITKNKFVNGFFKLFLSILRTLPSLVCALIATYIWGLGTFAGTVAIFIFSLSYVGKLLYESIETVDMGAFECMESIDFSVYIESNGTLAAMARKLSSIAFARAMLSIANFSLILA